MFNSVGTINRILLFCILISVYSTFAVKKMYDEKQYMVDSLKAQNSANATGIKILKAELSYVADYRKLKSLANSSLNLYPVNTSQIISNKKHNFIKNTNSDTVAYKARYKHPTRRTKQINTSK